jgi:hypothetical protein
MERSSFAAQNHLWLTPKLQPGMHTIRDLESLAPGPFRSDNLINSWLEPDNK